MLVEESERGSRGDSSLDQLLVPCAITDTGCERDLNEDRYAVVDSKSGLAWLVCDGMGGQTGGELAAQLAIDAIRRDLENLPSREPDMALKGAILEANRIIVLRRQNQAFAEMGTTIVSSLFLDQEVVLAHVGDSRAYLVRDGAIQQLTTDHTYVQELVNRGELRSDQALSHPQAHILTRAIGSEPSLKVDIQRYWIWKDTGEATDMLVLCTDGLYSHLSDGEIAATVSGESPQRACAKLVDIAKSRGGFDNITIAIIPLGGQLKQEPPQGYARSDVLRVDKDVKQPRTPVFGGQLKRDLLIVLILSVLASLLVVAVFALWQSA